jgi:hypothetical protein
VLGGHIIESKLRKCRFWEDQADRSLPCLRCRSRTGRCNLGRSYHRHISRATQPHVFALTRVCRHIRAETARLLYSGNAFAFSDPSAVRSFLEERTQEQIQAVRTIRLHVLCWPFEFHEHGYWDGGGLSVLATFPNITSIHINELFCPKGYTLSTRLSSSLQKRILERKPEVVLTHYTNEELRSGLMKGYLLTMESRR